ncbi:hypothetical protein D3C76_1416780 [compost metagenome]
MAIGARHGGRETRCVIHTAAFLELMGINNLQRRKPQLYQNLVEHAQFGLTSTTQPVAHSALSDADPLGEIFLRNLQITHSGFNQFSPIIHRWHDTDCPSALNTQIVVFKD